MYWLLYSKLGNVLLCILFCIVSGILCNSFLMFVLMMIVCVFFIFPAIFDESGGPFG